MKSAHLKIMGGLLAVLLLPGCAGYRLGPVNGQIAGARSVRVKFFENTTLEPRLRTAVNDALRKGFQRDGTLRLATRGDADLVVTGRLKQFTRNGVNYKPGDVLEVSDYNLQLKAEVTVTEASSGNVILQREVIGFTTVRVGTDLSSGERQGVPLIATELAKQALSLIVDGDWEEAGDAPVPPAEN